MAGMTDDEKFDYYSKLERARKKFSRGVVACKQYMKTKIDPVEIGYYDECIAFLYDEHAKASATFLAAISTEDENFQKRFKFRSLVGRWPEIGERLDLTPVSERDSATVMRASVVKDVVA